MTPRARRRIKLATTEDTENTEENPVLTRMNLRVLRVLRGGELIFATYSYCRGAGGLPNFAGSMGTFVRMSVN